MEQKRVLAQKLIDITLHTFQLPPEQRNRMNVQFVTESQLDRLDGREVIPRDADFKLEVIVHDLTESRKRAFGEQATSTFAELEPPTRWERIGRMMGLSSAPAHRVVFQFDELSPAVSDPLVMEQDRLAA